MNENDAERKTMMARPVPARPKGAPVPTPPPPLDELLQKRKVERAPAKFEFVEEGESPSAQMESAIKRGAVMEFREVEPPTAIVGTFDAFHDFVEIMRTLRKYPKPTRKQMVGLIAEMMLE